MHTRDRARRHAYSIVEIVVALVIAVGVIGAVIGLLIHTTAVFQRSEERTDAREAAHQALGILRHHLADALACRISKDRTRVTIVTNRQVAEFFLDRASGRLVLRTTGETPLNVSWSRVATFALVPIATGFLRVYLEIDRPSTGGRADRPPSFRTADDILIPCLISPDPRIPWHYPAALANRE